LGPAVFESFAYLAVVIAILQFCFFFAVHVVVWRLKASTEPRLKVMTKIAIITFFMGGVAANSEMVGATASSILLISLPVFVCLFVCYLHLYVGILKSVSLRIVGDLCQKPNFSEQTNIILLNFSPTDMVQNRLDLLEKNGWLVQGDAGYICQTKTRRLAALNIFMKKLYNLRDTG